MCICVDCHWIDRCQAYHAVERQHGVMPLNLAPDFVPQQPRIHVQVRDLPDAAGSAVGVEWDVRACASFEADAGRWQRLRPGAAVPT
ncbi:MAG: Ycf34 family protein [Cyanobacteriota bacterium]|nr:Ycf34 family protein [Cyanobacteriota bacterium]